MKVIGSRQRLCCGVWLLSAALIGGVNVSALMSLEARPTAGYSRTIRELRTNMQRFEAIQSMHGLPLRLSWWLPDSFNSLHANGSVLSVPSSTREQTQLRGGKPEPTLLPTLSGIIRTLDANGSVCFLAVLNGRSYRKNDPLDNNFTVDQITPAGVVLRRAEKTWFIQCPMPLYSSDQGE
jgi:hypothetical protein